MASNYDEIREDNIRRRGEEFEDIGNLIARELYSDKVHFIYELLQNAEDAGARKVVFNLFPDRLEFRHYGARPFQPADVRAISDVLRGTSAHNQSAIGRFGIGFKSVFAITARPEIHSGDEHFCIEQYIRPFAVEPIPLGHDETVMYFPFSDGGKSPYKAIRDRLRSFGARNLLFMRNVTEMEYRVEGTDALALLMAARTGNQNSTRTQVVSTGRYSREGTDLDFGLEKRVLRGMSAQGAEEVENEESFLLCQTAVRSPTGDARPLSIAYLLKSDGDEADGEANESVFPVEDAVLFVCFPTDQRTDFGFLVDGPFLTTPARDNVRRDEPWNGTLVELLADLVADSLRKLKSLGLLSVRLLEAMPIRSPETTTYCHGFLSLVYERVLLVLRSEPLLPGLHDEYFDAQSVILARGAEVRDLLSPEDLQQLYGAQRPLHWLSDLITQDRTPALRLYLLRQLAVDEMTPDVFAAHLDLSFIESRTDEWLRRFYGFLNSQSALWRAGRSSGSGPLRRKPIIRLDNGEHTVPFDDAGVPAAYLPSSRRTAFPTVGQYLVEDPEARRFLSDLGLTEPDVVDEVLRFVLPKYATLDTDGERSRTQVSDEENLEDVRVVLWALGVAHGPKLGALRESVRRTYLVRAKSANGENFCLPQDLYLERPELVAYFHDNDDAYFCTLPIDLDDEAGLIGIGSSTSVRVSFSRPDWSGHVVIRNEHSNHQRGLNGFDPRTQIDGLEHALKNITGDLACFIWNELLIPHSTLIRGIVERSSRQEFTNASRTAALSVAGELLVSLPWIPKGASFSQPGDVLESDLPAEFVRDEALLRQLGIRPAIPEEALEQLGMTLEEADLIRQNRAEFDRWVEGQKDAARRRAKDAQDNEADTGTESFAELLERAFVKSQVSEPDEYVAPGPVSNPALYQQRADESVEEDVAEEPNVRTRFRRVERRVWESRGTDSRAFLKEQYGGCCQVCGSVFFRRDGEPYFEGVYIVSQTKARWLNNAGNVLCLCPTCSAKFEHGSVQASSLLELVGSYAIEGGSDLSVPIELCDEKQDLVFRPRHIAMMRALLDQGGELAP